MTLPRHINRFRREEDGTLLVFFLVCTIAILGIVALSFDMGRRASTQTDMQAYADNVALAAAGELNGRSDAILRARRAARTVIDAANEQIKAGTAGQTATLSIDSLEFYEDLPVTDGPATFAVTALRDPASASYKYALPPPDINPRRDASRANYVGVRLTTVEVNWMFANVFNSASLPDPAIGAVAVAGRSPWSCDVAPLMFCLPDDSSGPGRLNAGQSIRLATARQGAIWREGDFGFLTVDVDTAGPCGAISNLAGRQACMITLNQRIAACFQNERADIETGQRPAQESSIFNMGFDIFEQSMIQFASNPDYAQGPHSISGRRPAGPGGQCTKTEAADTMAFPLDDCHPACPGGPFGNGDWTNGRETYLETNYTIWDSPYVPGDPVANAARTALVPGDFFDFPVSELSRYEFYQLEIQRAANGGAMPRYGGPVYQRDNDGGRGSNNPETVAQYTTWDDYWPDTFSGLNPIIPDAHGRIDNGLPQCNTSQPGGNGEERRVILAAAIDCPASGPKRVTGNAQDIRIEKYYELFLLQPADIGVGLPPYFELWVETVRPLDVDDFAVHDVVQLYR